MKIKLSEKEEQIARRFLEVKEDNICAAELYIEYLNEHYNDISSFDIKQLGQKYDTSTAFYKAFLKCMKIKNNDEDYKLINKTSKVDSMKVLDTKQYLNDEFAKTIGFPNCKKDDWILTKLHYYPYEGFVYDELKIDNEFYAETTPFGFFENEFEYLAVIQDEAVWMSVIPHEINTMKKPIEDAYGRVLVLGLGLGYYAFHISNKDDVEQITIVENDPKVIKLFKELILPKFPNKNKIKIVQDDAFNHLNEQHDYDFVFADIWHNVADGLGLYLRIKKYEDLYPNTRFEYWIETSILAMLRRQTLQVFDELMYGELTEDDYMKASNDNDRVINAIYFATKDYEINCAQDLRELLSDDSLRLLAKVLVLK